MSEVLLQSQSQKSGFLRVGDKAENQKIMEQSWKIMVIIIMAFSIMINYDYYDYYDLVNN